MYEGAITFLGGIVVFMSRKNYYYYFPLEKKRTNGSSSISSSLLRLLSLIFFFILLFVYLYIYRIHEPSGSGLSIFLLPSFALSLFLYVYDSLSVISHLSERSKNGILDLSVGTIVYSAPFGYWRAAGANLNERIQEVK